MRGDDLDPFEVIANEGVRAALRAQGDDGSATRHVRHFAYPQDNDPSMRAEMIRELQARGLQVSDLDSESGLLLEHHRPVAGDDFDRFTSDLRAWFAERAWDYDGWECAVVTPGTGVN